MDFCRNSLAAHKLSQATGFQSFPKACVDRLPGRMNAQESNVVEVLLPFWASWQLACDLSCFASTLSYWVQPRKSWNAQINQFGIDDKLKRVVEFYFFCQQ